MSGWDALERELDEWAAAGRAATFWWRDDDAVTASPELERLLEIRAAAALPLALAVIPARAEAALAARLGAAPDIDILQHGYAHMNHAAPEAKKCELGPERPAEAVLAELVAGAARLDELFGARSLRVMVPPWNRIDRALAPGLAARGFAGLSTRGPRPAPEAAPGLARVNVHVDLIDWPGTRRFVGLAAALGQVLEHLRQRRQGAADGDEPTGLMTHHLAHDGGCWDFLAALLARTRAHGAVRWCAAAELFGPGGARLA